MRPKVLTVAGSDSGGGAGIQADLKAITAMGGWGMTAITCLTAQSPKGVYGIHDVPAAFVTQQIDVVLRDLGADAMKTGMLSSHEIISAVAARLKQWRDAEGAHAPLVVDPVMVATSGARLLREDAVKALVTELLPLATVVTPNVPEAEVLAGMAIVDEAGLKAAGGKIHQLLKANNSALDQRYVLMKGGHLEGPEAVDWLYDGRKWQRFAVARVEVASTHGTGCSYAAALAAAMPQWPIEEAVRRAKAYVTRYLVEHSVGHNEGEPLCRR